MQQTNGESSFSIELKSKQYIKTISLENGNRDSVIVEGTLGELLYAQFSECIVLEIVGKKGTLRVDLSPDQIRNKTKSEVKKQ
jgi:hypothetical protein